MASSFNFLMWALRFSNSLAAFAAAFSAILAWCSAAFSSAVFLPPVSPPARSPPRSVGSPVAVPPLERSGILIPIDIFLFFSDSRLSAKLFTFFCTLSKKSPTPLMPPCKPLSASPAALTPNNDNPLRSNCNGPVTIFSSPSSYIPKT